MPNPIKYNDLFDSGVRTGVDSLKDSLAGTRSELEKMLDTARSRASELGKALSAANPSTEEGRNQIKQLATAIEELTSRYRELKGVVDQCNKSINSLEAVKNEAAARKEAARAAEAEAKAAAALARQKEAEAKAAKAATDASSRATNAKKQEEIAEQNLAAAIARREAAENRAINSRRSSSRTTQAYIGLYKDEINQEAILEASYNRLAATYKMLKDEINGMTGAERAAGTEGAKMIENARLIYEQMNKLQQATGRYQLQVGNYAKAFNGLDLAMQQVVRETPTITMGARMYFMAISNNIPILADQIKRIRDHNKVIEENVKAMRQQGEAVADIRAKQAEAIPVGQALMKSLLSWQTLMILGITILTQYGDKIVDWIKSLFQAKTAIDENAEALKRFREIYGDIEDAGEKASVKLRALYQITTDETAAEEDRIAAADALQKLYPDIFANYDKETIMVGDLKDKYDELETSIEKAAMTEAAFSKLSEVASRRINAKIKINNAITDLGFDPQNEEDVKSVTDLFDAMEKAAGEIFTMPAAMATQGGAWVQWNAARQNFNAKYTKDQREFYEAYKAGNKELEEAVQDEAAIMQAIMDEDLFNFGDGGGPKKSPRTSREEALKQVQRIELENIKYINDARKRELENIQDDYEREVYLTRWKYEQEIIELQKFAKEQTDIYSRLNNMIQRTFGISYEEWSATGAAMNSLFNGNVDLTNRPQIDASKLSAKGWRDAGSGTATVFSSQFGIQDARGNEREILVTPILPDGSVLSPSELEDYVFNVLSDTEDILAADSKGIVIAVDVDPDGSAGEHLHLLQEQYYTFVESLGDMSIEQKNAIIDNINALASQLKVSEDGIEAIQQLIATITAEETEALNTIERKNQQKGVDDQLKAVDDELKLSKLRIENAEETEEKIKELQLIAEIDAWERRLRIMEENANLYSNTEIEIIRQMLESARRALSQFYLEQDGGGSFLEKFFGKDFNKYLRSLERALRLTANNIKEIISLYEEMAKAAVDAAEEQVKAAEKVYDAELNAYENGYANNVEFARKELELRRMQLAEAQAEQERYARMQERIDSITQVSSMVTAAANILKGFSSIPIVGQALGIAAIAAMFTSFAAAKIQARQLAAQQYGEGGTEYIGYGGSHASGNDVDFGHMPDGRPRRVERGETVAVINARQTGRYGYPMVSEIIDSINRGQFVEKYMGTFSGADGEFSVNMQNTFDSPYLSTISSDIKAIRKGGERSETVVGGTRITRYKNITRRIVS